MRRTLKSGIILVAIAMAVLAVQQAFAEGEIRAGLSHGNVDLTAVSTASGAGSVPAFILEDRETTDKLLFVSRSGFAGVYFKGADGIEEYDGNSFTLNDVEYAIARGANSYRISSTQRGSLMIGRHASNTIILPNDGRNVKILVGSTERTERLPATVVFNRAAGTDFSDAGERAAEIAGVSGEAPTGAREGCVDADKNDAHPNQVPSYVTVTTREGAQTVVADYCAVSGDVTWLYEAVCDDGTAKVMQVACPVNMLCPTGEGACRRDTEVSARFCEKTDTLARDDSPSLIYSTGTKGIMMGSYAATIRTAVVAGETVDIGREFGVWSDYCRDSKTLIEYYCTPGGTKRGLFREVICPRGCSDGKCETPPFCYDSDGGAYPTVRGTIRGVNASSQYFAKTDSCKDSSTVIEYTCIAGTKDEEANRRYLSNGFAYEEIPCGEGKHCSEGRCVSGAAPAPVCLQCDPLNTFNIRQGTACAGATPTAWALKRCPAGQYCSANACVAEPKATIAQVTTAFENRNQWALLLNETLSWIETAKQIAPLTSVITSGGYAGIMEDIATGLSSTQSLLIRRQIMPDVGAGMLGGGAFGGGLPR
ncbi:MAG: hypothetical protein QME12_08925 [Nanoarchaeota archaeon]|nr:hypothetical protein [Nanoarchaeota archaeon]